MPYVTVHVNYDPVTTYTERKVDGERIGPRGRAVDGCIVYVSEADWQEYKAAVRSIDVFDRAIEIRIEQVRAEKKTSARLRARNRQPDKA